MYNVVLVKERYRFRQLAHEALVGLGVGPTGQDVLVEIPALTKLHDEPQVARLFRVAQDALACRLKMDSYKSIAAQRRAK